MTEFQILAFKAIQKSYPPFLTLLLTKSLSTKLVFRFDTDPPWDVIRSTLLLTVLSLCWEKPPFQNICFSSHNLDPTFSKIFFSFAPAIIFGTEFITCDFICPIKLRNAPLWRRYSTQPINMGWPTPHPDVSLIYCGNMFSSNNGVKQEPLWEAWGFLG